VGKACVWLAYGEVSGAAWEARMDGHAGNGRDEDAGKRLLRGRINGWWWWI
jgi:hypothetical protein